MAKQRACNPVVAAFVRRTFILKAHFTNKKTYIYKKKKKCTAVSPSISIITSSLKSELICGALKPKTARRYEFFIKRSSRKVCGRRRICWMMAADMSHRQQRPWPELRALFLVCRVNGFRAGRRGRRSLAAFSSSSQKN